MRLLLMILALTFAASGLAQDAGGTTASAGAIPGGDINEQP